MVRTALGVRSAAQAATSQGKERRSIIETGTLAPRLELTKFRNNGHCIFMVLVKQNIS